MFHTQSLCRALQLESILAVIPGYRTFEENSSTWGPEAILWNAWVSAHVEVIEPYIDTHRENALNTSPGTVFLRLGPLQTYQ